MRVITASLIGLASVIAVLLIAPTVLAANYAESITGDLSNNKAAPAAFALTSGSNMVTGSVNGSTDSQDWIAVTVPSGFRLSNYVNVSYSGADAQGFTGFNAGSSFAGDPFTAGSYAGYAHFGTGATNSGVNGGAPTSTVGIDLLST